MNILLVAYAFPPDPLVGSFRARKVADALRGAGHHVEVVTARLPGDEGRHRSSPHANRVHAVRPLPRTRSLYIALRSLVGRGRRDGVSSDATDAEFDAEPRQVARWKRWVLSLLHLPDDHLGFVVPAFFRAWPIVRKGIDVVYTTAPPFSDHLVGDLLKKLTGVRWVAEFRDPWSDGPERSPATRSRAADAVNRWLERRCLRHADHIVTVAANTRDLLLERMPPDRRDRMVLAYNGIDEIDAEPATRPPGGPFRIVYTGSFGAGRDPRPFLEALARLKARRGLSARDLQVEFIGGNRYHGRPVVELAAALGVSDLVRFEDWLPQEACRERMRRADLLLLLFRGQRLQIPNKLYDYLGVRRPILAMVDPACEAARMLQKLGGRHLVTDDDPESIAEIVELSMQEQNDAVDPAIELDVLQEWTTDVQIGRLMEALGLGRSGSECCSPLPAAGGGHSGRGRDEVAAPVSAERG